ncbi:MAG: methyl-accepting chemotaxis protein, partial [Deltaproteobacteria bacterium]|nr:methyl-accepting chemotaxis protein [Deltaproteobacteria bacterium]
MRLPQLRTLRNQLVASAFGAVLVTAAVTAATILYVLHDSLLAQAREAQEKRIRVLWELLGDLGNTFRVEGDRLLIGEHVLNGDFEIVDEVKRLVGGTATLFLGDTRIATNVLNDKGARAVGTKLQGPAREAVLVKGERFRGETTILGVPYLTAYDPIRDASGRVIGVVYVGERKDEFFEAFRRIEMVSTAVAVVLVLAFGAITLAFIARKLQPLHDAVELARRVADGDIRPESIRHSGALEIDVLSESMTTLVERIGQVISETAGFAGELADAAQQLCASTTVMADSNQAVTAQSQSVAAAAEEMSATVTQIAMNTQTAEESSHLALGAAKDGADRTTRLVEGMAQIRDIVEHAARTVEATAERSAEIGRVASAIEDIADQTNLLALNAAIEAA